MHSVIKQWIRQRGEKRVLSLNSCPNYHKDFSQEPICLGSQLSNQRFITPALQRVNRSGNICEASRFDSINRRASSVKQHSHDALISLWSAFLCHRLTLSLFRHKQTAQGVKYPVWQVCGSDMSLYTFIKWCGGGGIIIIWAIHPENAFWMFQF